MAKKKIKKNRPEEPSQKPSKEIAWQGDESSATLTSEGNPRKEPKVPTRVRLHRKQNEELDERSRAEDNFGDDSHRLLLNDSINAHNEGHFLPDIFPNNSSGRKPALPVITEDGVDSDSYSDIGPHLAASKPSNSNAAAKSSSHSSPVQDKGNSPSPTSVVPTLPDINEKRPLSGSGRDARGNGAVGNSGSNSQTSSNGNSRSNSARTSSQKLESSMDQIGNVFSF